MTTSYSPIFTNTGRVCDHHLLLLVKTNAKVRRQTLFLLPLICSILPGRLPEFFPDDETQVPCHLRWYRYWFVWLVGGGRWGRHPYYVVCCDDDNNNDDGVQEASANLIQQNLTRDTLNTRVSLSPYVDTLPQRRNSKTSRTSRVERVGTGR